MKPIGKSHGEVNTPSTRQKVLRKFACLCAILLTLNGPAISALDSQSTKNPEVASIPRVEVTIPDSSDIQRITTRDGATFQGRTLAIGTEEIEFQTRYGTVKIPISNISTVRQIPKKQLRNGELWFANPNATRLFFAPTGRMLKQGQGYFADYYVFFPSVALGITDRFTIGGGMSIFPDAGVENQVFFLTPKVGVVARETCHFAVGTLIAKVADEATAGILYGVSTFGTTDNSLTLGLGYGFEDGNLADRPMIMLGFEKRFTPRTAFVSENWIFPGVENPLLAFGVRIFGEQLSVDVGLVNTLGEDAVFPGVPYLDIVVQF